MESETQSLGPVAVIGTTTWGTTLAIVLARRGIEVRLLARTFEEASVLEQARENPRLKGHSFPPSMTVTDDWQAGLDGATAAVLGVPSRSVRENVIRARPHLEQGALVICATKGIELGSSKRMSELLMEELPAGTRVAALSGPNLAHEVVRGLPTSTVVAAATEEIAREAQGLFNSTSLRVYTNTDLIGVELGGALKNVIAIGAGIIDGMGLGDNAKAAFLTRGLAEITRLGVAAGAQPMTFMGNAGLGDLMVSAFSGLARNHQVGIALANGMALDAAIESLGGQVAEGVMTSRAALELANGYGIEMPITELTCRVLFDGLSPKDALAALMVRNPTQE